MVHELPEWEISSSWFTSLTVEPLVDVTHWVVSSTLASNVSFGPEPEAPAGAAEARIAPERPAHASSAASATAMNRRVRGG